MSPLGEKIMALKRRRASASVIGDRQLFWILTLHINILVRHSDKS